MATGHWYDKHWHEWHWHDDHWVRVPIVVVDPTEDLFRKVGIQTQLQRVFDVGDVSVKTEIATEVRQVLDIADSVRETVEIATEVSVIFDRPEVRVVMER